MKVKVIKKYNDVPVGSVLTVDEESEHEYVCVWTSMLGTYMRYMRKDTCEIIKEDKEPPYVSDDFQIGPDGAFEDVVNWDDPSDEQLPLKKSGRVEKFLNEIVVLCSKYNLSISHEDTQGAFIIEEFKDSNIMWLEQAVVK